MDNDQIYKLELTITGAKDNWDALTEWEQSFLISVEERFKEWGERMRVSVKQWDVIDRIYAKVV